MPPSISTKYPAFSIHPALKYLLFYYYLHNPCALSCIFIPAQCALNLIAPWPAGKLLQALQNKVRRSGVIDSVRASHHLPGLLIELAFFIHHSFPFLLLPCQALWYERRNLPCLGTFKLKLDPFRLV